MDGNVVIGTAGGVYLGGTGTANKLDDYEEGTWTPTDTSGASLSFTIHKATYTKVGRVVHLYVYITFPSTTSTHDISISGLPFTAASSSYPPSALYAGGLGSGYSRVAESEIAARADDNINYDNVDNSGSYFVGQYTYEVS